MTNDETPPTAPGFRSLPIAPEPEGRFTAPAVRRSWSVRRRVATVIAMVALAGSGGAVATAALSAESGGSDGAGEGVTPAQVPAQIGGESWEDEHGDDDGDDGPEPGEHESDDSDEA